MAEHVTLCNLPRGCGQWIGWMGNWSNGVRDGKLIRAGDIGVLCNVALIHERDLSSLIIVDCSVIHGLLCDEPCTVMHWLRKWN